MSLAGAIQNAIEQAVAQSADAVRLAQVVATGPIEFELMDTSLNLPIELVDISAWANVYMATNTVVKGDIALLAYREDGGQGNWTLIDFVNESAAASSFGFVPYTGAVSDVSLGTHALNAGNIGLPSGGGIYSTGYIVLKTGALNDQLLFLQADGSEMARFVSGSGLVMKPSMSYGWSASAGTGTADTIIYRNAVNDIATAGWFHGAATAGQHKAFQVGDDASIWDVDTADTMNVRGEQTPANGKISFGVGNDTNIYRNAASELKTDSNFTSAAQIKATTYVDANNASVVFTAGDLKASALRTLGSGWLKCDGSANSRTTFATLWSAIAPNLGATTITLASPGVFTLNGHGLVNGDTVFLTTTGTLPTPLVANTVLYFVVGATANTFQLSTSRGGGPIPTTVGQSGVHSTWFCPYGLGDGSTTFNVPDFRGRSVAGADPTAASGASGATIHTMGQKTGEETHLLSGNESGTSVHNHSQNAHGHTGLGSTAGEFAALGGSGAFTIYGPGSQHFDAHVAGWTIAANTATNIATTAANAAAAHNTLSPVNFANWFIKT